MQHSHRLPSKSQLAFYGLVTLLLLTCSSLTFAQKEKNIYAFHGVPDGYSPQSPLIVDTAGNLYGNTYSGGTSYNGTTFQLSPPAVSGGAWTETVLHDFTDTGNDGGGPLGNLALDAAGNLFGIANNGGSGGHGIVFELSPPATKGGAWTETVIASADFANLGLAGGVSMDSQGNLYWANDNGGDLLSCSGGCGSIFQASPPLVLGGSWTITDLYDFGTNGGSNDALQPINGVTVTKSGVLFGVTPSGGANGSGAVYKLTPPAVSGGAWTETVVYSFLGGTTTDGNQPVGTILIKSGVLFGATFAGGTSGYGTVYQITPPASGLGWKETVIYNFTGSTDGGVPLAGVVTDGQNLYGTTERYGGVGGVGTAYKLSVSGGSWTLTTLHTFTGLNRDGSYPQAPLLLYKGTLFGTTKYGGIREIDPSGWGVVFKLGK